MFRIFFYHGVTRSFNGVSLLCFTHSPILPFSLSFLTPHTSHLTPHYSYLNASTGFLVAALIE